MCITVLNRYFSGKQNNTKKNRLINRVKDTQRQSLCRIRLPVGVVQRVEDEEAAREHGIDLSRSWMIGDHDNDMRAGAAAGTGTIRVQGLKEISVASDFRVADVPALRRLLLELL